MDLALGVLGVVVHERHGTGTRSVGAFPQRHMGQHVQVDRRAFVGNALQQAHIGHPAGLAQDAVLGAAELRQLALQPAGGIVAILEHRRHQQLAIRPAHGGRLRAHQLVFAEQAKIVVAGEVHGVGPRLPAVQQVAAAPALLYAFYLVPRHPRGDKVRPGSHRGGGLVRRTASLQATRFHIAHYIPL